MYIVFEGIDTAGKSTQVALLEEQLSQSVTTKEPGGTSFGETIRDIVLSEHTLDAQTEFLLFLADRREHFKKFIEPALADSREIISDRSFISGIAYALANQTLDLQGVMDISNGDKYLEIVGGNEPNQELTLSAADWQIKTDDTGHELSFDSDGSSYNIYVSLDDSHDFELLIDEKVAIVLEN